MTSDVSAMYAPEQVLSTSRELQAMHAGIDPSWSTLYPRGRRDANPDGPWSDARAASGRRLAPARSETP